MDFLRIYQYWPVQEGHLQLSNNIIYKNLDTSCKLSDKDRLVREHAHLVKYIAQRLAMKLPPHIELDDLISTGMMGLLDAIDKFDAGRDVKFTTYAQIRIKGAMLDELRGLDWVPRSLRSTSDEIERVYSALEKRLGRPATEEEVAEEMGLSLDEFMTTLGEISGAAMLRIEDFSSKSGDMDLLDVVADQNGVDPQTIIRKREVREALSNAIDNLPEKEKLVVTLYYYEELTMKEAGAVLDLTESRVCQLHTQAMLRLKGKLKGKV